MCFDFLNVSKDLQTDSLFHFLHKALKVNDFFHRTANVLVLFHKIIGKQNVSTVLGFCNTKLEIADNNQIQNKCM